MTVCNLRIAFNSLKLPSFLSVAVKLLAARIKRRVLAGSRSWRYFLAQTYPEELTGSNLLPIDKVTLTSPNIVRIFAVDDLSLSQRKQEVSL